MKRKETTIESCQIQIDPNADPSASTNEYGTLTAVAGGHRTILDVVPTSSGEFIIEITPINASSLTQRVRIDAESGRVIASSDST